MLRLFGFLFTAGVIVFLVGAAGAAYILWMFSQELPEYEVLANYEPEVMSRLHANDGRLIAEYAREERLYVPVEAVPDVAIHAFVSAEDKNFFEHGGIDIPAIFRAALVNIRNYQSGRRLVGASTITQQVAKNFLLSSERSFERKIKEAMLAIRIERTFDKSEILELYLNEIYFGMGSYGIAAASLNYFNKELHELEVHEAAYLAALPKAPNNYHPFDDTDRALSRRNWVIDQMHDNGYITAEQAEAAKAKGLEVDSRPFRGNVFAGEYFAEEVRRTLVARYGEDTLYGGGLSVRTTLDPELQVMARKALREGLVAYDRRHGYRGPVDTMDVSGDWGRKLAEREVLDDIEPWRMAVILDVTEDKAEAGLRPSRSGNGGGEENRRRVTIPFEEIEWAREQVMKDDVPARGPEVKSATEVLSVGDVVYVAPPEAEAKDGEDAEPADAEVREIAGFRVRPGAEDGWRLMQVPEVGGALTVMDPHTGRVLAHVGGFSFDKSEFDRGIQALRQPGSAFKPFVYAAALDNGYTPSSIVLDAPIAIEQTGEQGLWRPKNYGDKFYGPSTLRLGVEKSRNLMTVRLAQDVGMPIIREYARRFEIYDDLKPVLSMALGAGETSLMRMVAGYSMFVNGGNRIMPTLIDRIQNRYGETIWRHDQRECEGCDAEAWLGQDEPELVDNRERVIDAMTAYQIVSILEGVVKRGTGYRAKEIGKPVAGKTGTTNEEKDAWFVGFTPNLTAGAFVGFDSPKPMGRGETGGGVASPIFVNFMEMALEDRPAVPFRVPEGIKLIRVNAKTGLRAQEGDKDVIMEAFKPGNEPPDPFSYVGYPNAFAPGSENETRNPEAGGLY
ncbi:MAG: penicillin-binding protein 1A [Dichotomicrobium sp.]